MLSEAKHLLVDQTKSRFFASLRMTRSKKLGRKTRIDDAVLRSRFLTPRRLTGMDKRTQSLKIKTLRYLMLFAAGMLAIGALAASPAAKPTLERVGNQVYCQCGCVTTLNHCPHLPSECQSRAQMQTLILKDVKQGKDDKGILADLVDHYGVHVLASPPATGFNLTVWVLPGVGLIIGLLIVLIVVRRWRAKVSGGETPPADTPIDPKIMAAIEEEMHKIETTKD